MTDELRTPSNAGKPTRRAYVRPELVEFGSVKELTRGASGNAKDGGKSRAPGKGKG